MLTLEERSFRKLVCENIKLVNFGRFGEKVACLHLRHQGRRHRAFKMCVACSFGVERVEDGEGRRPHLNGKP